MQTLVRLGQAGRAERTLAELDEQQRDQGAMRIAAATVRLARNDPRAAASVLAPVLDGSAPVTIIAWLSQAFLLEAIARDALGDPGAAERALERALDLAEPDGRNTVKTHIRHLYEKLGTNRRSEAVTRACALGLLAPAGRR